ncbi:putative lipoprotein [Gracilibacillus halophilus YIM-C55.5]|uniref:Putative lipoprotein n=1 Tax=Gracilibacillus halophilus YIM-C55.5 TaxID=1308866 RepID=N4WA51_9BACI|nr:hypothetical protein [Gracilibacillus halophilus]ENH96134.1 putative lipoprotein [Gracilibacillus halophilus YIM-C55.5]
MPIYTPLMFFILSFTLIAGCGENNYIYFSGESTHWNAEFKLKQSQDSKHGTYFLYYKDKSKKQTNVVININNGETIKTIKEMKHSKIQIPINCSGCYTKSEKSAIDVVIKWNGKEETIQLESNN